MSPERPVGDRSGLHAGRSDAQGEKRDTTSIWT